MTKQRKQLLVMSLIALSSSVCAEVVSIPGSETQTADAAGYVMRVQNRTGYDIHIGVAHSPTFNYTLVNGTDVDLTDYAPTSFMDVVFYNDYTHFNRIGQFFPAINHSCLTLGWDYNNSLMTMLPTGNCVY